MQHVTVKAAVTATDLGQFTALAAVSGNVDRAGDRIVKGAFADSIEAWAQTGRLVPLHWSHGTDPEDIVGAVTSMDETAEGLVVEGRLDLEGSERAREAWRAMKTRALGLSFGYVTQRHRKASDGATELLQLDLFEVSLAPAPANERARVLSMKNAEDGQQRSHDEPPAPPSHDEQLATARKLGMRTLDDERIRNEARRAMLRLLAQADEKALPDEPPSHTELEVQLIREGYITRPAALENYERIDPVVLGTDNNGHGSSDEKAFATMPAIKIASFEV